MKERLSNDQTWCTPIPHDRKVSTVQDFYQAFHDASTLPIRTCMMCYRKRRPLTIFMPELLSRRRARVAHVPDELKGLTLVEEKLVSLNSCYGHVKGHITVFPNNVQELATKVLPHPLLQALDEIHVSWQGVEKPAPSDLSSLLSNVRPINEVTSSGMFGLDGPPDVADVEKLRFACDAVGAGADDGRAGRERGSDPRGGSGDIVSSRSLNLRIWADIVLRRHGGRFALHHIFAFLVFNMGVRSRNRRVSMLSVARKDFGKVERVARSMTAQSSMLADIHGEDQAAYRERIIRYVDSVFSEDLDQEGFCAVQAGDL
ncbi:hypothetical protein HRG_013436 [Hirsutella rhossiliensis]